MPVLAGLDTGVGGIGLGAGDRHELWPGKGVDLVVGAAGVVEAHLVGEALGHVFDLDPVVVIAAIWFCQYEVEIATAGEADVQSSFGGELAPGGGGDLDLVTDADLEIAGDRDDLGIARDGVIVEEGALDEGWSACRLSRLISALITPSLDEAGEAKHERQ